jgi:hypothetical protein
MKLLLAFIMIIAIQANTLADDKYEQAMKKNVAKIDECKSAEDYIRAANAFERISMAESDKWLPNYYASMLYVLACFTDTVNANKDPYLDRADFFIAKADSLEPDNSEIYTMKGMISQGRLQIDPMNRWQRYIPESEMNFKKAIELDTLNPRPEYLMGVSAFYTPEQFGGGPLAAKTLLESSMRKYEQFVPANDLMPIWGKEHVLSLLEEINK